MYYKYKKFIHNGKEHNCFYLNKENIEYFIEWLKDVTKYNSINSYAYNIHGNYLRIFVNYNYTINDLFILLFKFDKWYVYDTNDLYEYDEKELYEKYNLNDKNYLIDF